MEPTHEVLAPPPAYCRQVKAHGSGKVDDAALESLDNRLRSLGAETPFSEELAALGGDLSHLMARLVLGPDRCLRAKAEVTAHMTQCRPGQAQKILEHAAGRTQHWGHS